MKKYLLILVVLLSFNGFAQENHRVSLQYGPFVDLFFGAEDVGFFLKGSYGYKMKNDIWVNLNITQAEIRSEFSDGMLFIEPSEITDTYRIFGIDFSKSFQIKSKSLISTGLGLVYHEWFHSHPVCNFVRDENYNLYLEDCIMNGEVVVDPGMSLNVDYKYKLKSGVYIGVTAETHYLFGIGFSGLYLGPQVEIRL